MTARTNSERQRAYLQRDGRRQMVLTKAERELIHLAAGEHHAVWVPPSLLERFK